jgi:hypothetical protein
MSRFFINPLSDYDSLFQAKESTYDSPILATDFTGSETDNVRFFRYALKRPPINPDWQRPDSDLDYTNPATIHQMVAGRSPQIHPGTGAEPWRVELARWECPYGTTGIIRAVEQYVSTLEGEQKTVWSDNAHWGDPFCGFGTWRMVIEDFTTPAPAWVSQLNPGGPFPGIPYQDWPGSEGIWYPAGSPSANNVHLPTPAGRRIRVFWDYPGTKSLLPTVAVLLRGSIHGQFAPETKVPLRSEW